MLDDKLIKKLRNKQATAIKKSHQSISFSKIINEILSERVQSFSHHV